jgi:lysozyme
MNPKHGITQELIDHVKAMEGFRAKPYLCPAGYPTIGYGSRIPSLEHRPLKEPEAAILLLADLMVAQRAALKLSPILHESSERRAAAIIDFCFNLGGASYGKSTMKVMIDKAWWREAAAQNDRWVFARNPTTKRMERLPGLIKRRAATSEWLRAG